MDILPFHFRVFQNCGLWFQSEKEFRLLKLMYKSIVVSSGLLLTLGQLIEFAIIAIEGNMTALTESLFVTLTYLTFSSKMINFLYRRKSLDSMLNDLRIQLCQPKDLEEEDIIIRTQDIATKLSIIFLSCVLATVVLIFLSPLNNLFKEGKYDLPYAMYHPYAFDNAIKYGATYLFQVIAGFYSATLNIMLDTLATSLMLYTRGQFEVCSYRFSQSKQTDISASLRTCINHQILLRGVVEKLQSFFMNIILLQFFAQLLILCTNIFGLSQTSIGSMEFFLLLLYLLSMLNQIFLYCWSGNELALISANIVDTVYEYDWTDLTLANKKNIFLIMTLGQKELNVSQHGVCVLSLNTFVWIVKTSFAAFNLLKTISEEK